LTATFTAFEKKMESEICRVQGALQRRQPALQDLPRE
jgi:hypothetical protein